MDIPRLIKEHKPLWNELELLLEQFEGKPRLIRGEQLDRLAVAYKQVSAHLAYAQTFAAGDSVVEYLNRLTARAHNMLFQEQNKSTRQLSDFFGRRLIGLIRKRVAFIGFACLLFALGGVSGFLAVLADPLNLYVILPANISEHVDPSRLGEGHDQLSNPIISSEIMTNNIFVAVLAFVSGITFGIWTVYLLLYNGLIVGALAAVFWNAGQSYAFWAYILPHGVIELTAIFIAGGAGLYMGYRMLVPGPYPRLLIFRQSAKESAMLLLGTLPLFVAAALIEGYVTPSALSLEVKYGVALLTLLLLAAYYLHGAVRLGPPAGGSLSYSASLDFKDR